MAYTVTLDQLCGMFEMTTANTTRGAALEQAPQGPPRMARPDAYVGEGEPAEETQGERPQDPQQVGVIEVYRFPLCKRFSLPRLAGCCRVLHSG